MESPEYFIQFFFFLGGRAVCFRFVFLWSFWFFVTGCLFEEDRAEEGDREQTLSEGEMRKGGETWQPIKEK